MVLTRVNFADYPSDGSVECPILCDSGFLWIVLSHQLDAGCCCYVLWRGSGQHQQSMSSKKLKYHASSFVFIATGDSHQIISAVSTNHYIVLLWIQ